MAHLMSCVSNTANASLVATTVTNMHRKMHLHVWHAVKLLGHDSELLLMSPSQERRRRRSPVARRQRQTRPMPATAAQSPPAKSMHLCTWVRRLCLTSVRATAFPESSLRPSTVEYHLIRVQCICCVRQRRNAVTVQQASFRTHFDCAADSIDDEPRVTGRRSSGT